MESDKEAFAAICRQVGSLLCALISFAKVDSVSHQERVEEEAEELGNRIHDWANSQ